MRALHLLVLPLALSLGSSAFAVENPARKAHVARAGAPSVQPAAPPASGAGKEPSGRGRGRQTLHGTVNINAADEATLELLPGVGEVTAAKIVAYRKQRPFKRVEDLTRVKGIGKKKLARMKPFLAISGPSTLAEEDAPPPEITE